MRTIVPPEAMRRMDAAAIEAGTPGLTLMERAAQALVDELHTMLGGLKGRLVVCYCGKGNNGGDGYAAARLIADAGGHAVIREMGMPSTPDAVENRSRAANAGVAFSERTPAAADAAIDALLGTGISRAPEGVAATLINEMMGLGVPILSADVPSGMDARTGQLYQPHVVSTRTVSFQFAKAGQLLTTQPEAMGTWRVAGIGIPAGSIPHFTALDASDLAQGLPKRKRTAHKGNHGRVLACCGSVGMAGAAAMAAMAALRAGAGLLTIICDNALMPILQTLVPEAQCATLEPGKPYQKPYDILLAGCGLGQSEETWDRIMTLYRSDKPTVLDADALNMLAKHPMRLGGQTIITPHVGEAARLLGWSPRDVVLDMLSAAEALHAKFGCTVVLKSHTTVIYDGQNMALNDVGSPVLAKGGSGDTLAGIIAGLLAQGMLPFDAARYGCLWLGKAAQLAEAEMGPYAPLARDIQNYMGAASLS